MAVEEKHATLTFDGVGDIIVEYDTNNSLPTALGKNKVPGVVKKLRHDVGILINVGGQSEYILPTIFSLY